MTNIEESVKAFITKNGKKFEILVNLENALKLKNKEEINPQDVFITEKIYSDEKKGEVSPNQDLQKAFGTENINEINKIIIEKGEIQLSTEYRKKLREKKLKQILNEINSNALDPKTNLPIPITRLENALEKVNYKVNEFKPIKEQVTEAVQKIRTIMPISINELSLTIKIPARHTAKILTHIQRIGKIAKQDWQTNGDLIIKITAKPGNVEELKNAINKNTNGLAQITTE